MGHAKAEDCRIVLQIEVGGNVLLAMKTITLLPMGLDREAEVMEEQGVLLSKEIGNLWIKTARGNKLDD